MSEALARTGYGHADLLTARDAEYLVGEPILEWIKTHR